MALFDTDLLRRYHYLSLVARRAGGVSFWSGRRTKNLPGGGTEPTGLRDYAPGDEYLHVDWKLCARRDDLLTKQFESTPDETAHVLLDCSASMGQGDPPKFQIARRIAAVLGYSALLENNRLSISLFADGMIGELPPLRGKARFPRVLRFLQELAPQTAPTATNLTQTAEGFVRRFRGGGPVVVLSDLYEGEGFQQAFDILRYNGFDPRVVQIHEAAEAVPGLLGDLEFLDVESEATVPATVTERAAERYAALFAEFHESVRDYCRGRAIRLLQIANNVPEDAVLLHVLGGSTLAPS